MQPTLQRSLLTAAAASLLASGLGACAGQPGSAIPTGAQSALHPSALVPKARLKNVVVYTQGITSGSTPRGITEGFGPWMWFTQPGSNQIGHINKNGVVQELTATTGGVNNIVTGRDGNIWFTQNGSDTIGRITPKGKINQFAVGNEAYGPFDICNGGDGNLWFPFRSPSTNAIGRITRKGAVTLFTDGLSPGDIAVHDIAEGGDGNVWFTEEFNNRIGRITPSGAIVEYSDGISANAGLADITAGPDGSLWFTENAVNQIGRITTGGAVTEFSQGISPQGGPGSIASARGYVWFTESNASNLGRVSANGSITEYPIPVSLGSDIAQGSSGTLWITDYTGNSVLKVTP
jgi:streptogramin lyase